MKTVTVVAAATFQNTKFLITQRNDGDFKGLWEVPGGKIEKGETHQEALVREIQEELGVLVNPHTLLTSIHYQYPTFKLIMHVYVCDIIKGKPTLTEHSNLKWVSQDEIHSINWLPADTKLIKPLYHYYDSVK